MPERDDQAGLRHLAHEMRNALNGVAVNLEVARSRATNGSDISRIIPFIETAAQQLETATKLHKALTDLTLRMTSRPDGSASGR